MFIYLVSRIVGAYLIKPFNEGDFVQKVLHLHHYRYVYLYSFRQVNPRVPWPYWVSLKLLVGEHVQLGGAKR